MTTKPLGHKAYTSIGHLPGSRTGSADRHIPHSQAELLVNGPLDRHMELIVQEKYDGSCVSVARIQDNIVALGRQGDLARASRTPIRRLWAAWVKAHEARFLNALQPGERFVGEWLPIAHGTHYAFEHEPFIVFDWFPQQMQRGTFDELCEHARLANLITPSVLHRGGAVDVATTLQRLDACSSALDTPEGTIWRLEGIHRQSGQRQVKLITKHVREHKTPGAYLPELTGNAFVWNTFPDMARWQSLFDRLATDPP